MRRISYVWIGLPFLLVGLGILGDALWNWHRARLSLGWSVVDGLVTMAEVHERITLEGSAGFEPRIVYVYDVAGEPYESDRLTFGRAVRMDADTAQAWVAPYDENPHVRVYVNPRQPADAVLRPGDHAGLGLRIGMGGFFAVLGLATMFRGRLRPARD